jgi:hypothetical protein
MSGNMVMDEWNTAPAGEYKECFKCSFRGETAEANCPKCGKKLRTSKNIRVRGVIQLITGSFLVLMMAGLSGFIWYLTHNRPLSPDEQQRIAEQQTLFMGLYAFFAVIGLFGLNGIVMGVWQLAFGRRNKPLIWVMFGLLALILLGCVGIAMFVK